MAFEADKIVLYLEAPLFQVSFLFSLFLSPPSLSLSITEISGGSGGGNGICLVCIVVPIAVLLAIILAVIVAVALYAFYRWKNAPPTNLKEKDAEGINGYAPVITAPQST